MKRITLILFSASVALFLLSLGNISLVRSEDEIKISSSKNPASPGKDGPVFSGVGGVTNPERTKFIRPKYPDIALRTMIEADVTLQAVVRSNGKVGKVEPLKVQINTNPKIEAEFVEQATRAIKMWRYKPAQKNGKPVGIYMTVVIKFREG